MSITHPLSVQKASLKKWALIFIDPNDSEAISVLYKQNIKVPMFEKPYRDAHVEVHNKF